MGGRRKDGKKKGDDGDAVIPLLLPLFFPSLPTHTRIVAAEFSRTTIAPPDCTQP